MDKSQLIEAIKAKVAMLYKLKDDLGNDKAVQGVVNLINNQISDYEFIIKSLYELK